MPAIEPPATCPGHPVTSTLPAGSVLYRVHQADRAAHEFNLTPRPPPPPGDPVEGGRFDSIDGSYAYLYAALTEEGAFCESFVRDLDYARAGPRPLPWARVSGKVVSTVRTCRDVELVEIQGAAAEQLGQDDWLTRCDEDAYPLTRRWATAVRAWLPPTHRDGLGWQSKRDPEQRVMVLWGEPAGAPTGCQVLEPDDGVAQSEALDGGFGLVRLSAFLTPWRLYLER
ncbi:MAG TPA: RES family NAD+ phosphorylase [Acidimicrobiales bacterium]|nr:RES family NAD+ phosphorylase [Acidimicrobiales bacterium]